MLSYPMRLLRHRHSNDVGPVPSFPRVLRMSIVVGLLFSVSTGCQRIFTMPNSMCPPQRLMSQNQMPPQQQGVYHPPSQGFANVSPIVSQPDLGRYSEHVERSQKVRIDSPVPPVDTGDYAPPSPPSSIGAAKAKDLDVSLAAIVEVVDKLHAANAENAKLREKLSKAQEENRQKAELALKATQFAERLRSDNMQLQTDLKTWEDRIGQLENLFAQRQTQQEDVLIDIEDQLDQLITEYESDRSNTTTLNTSSTQ